MSEQAAPNTLTVFAIPKVFQGHFKVIQTNAIRSWTLLRPKPEVILLGDDEGTSEIASELGTRHQQQVERNHYGTPLARSIFQAGQGRATNSLLCYINSDIILMADFMKMVATVISAVGDRPLLVVGRKVKVDLPHLLDFADPDWELPLKKLAAERGRYVTYDSDFFLFRRGTFEFDTMPPLAIGRCFWTQWLIFDARRRGIPVIDATRAVLSIESNHDYSHVLSTGGAKRLSGPEYRLNRSLFKGCKYFTTVDATHVVLGSGLMKAPSLNRILSLWVRAEYYVYFLLKGSLYPYSLPLILSYRWARASFRAVATGCRFVLAKGK